jgi:membrane protease YdiL (CAAX protease family)
MKKAFALYMVGIAAVGLTIWQPSLGWLSPLVYVFVLPACAFWLWRSEGRTLQDLGLGRGKFWRQTLSWGLLLGLMFPAIMNLVQALCGWIIVTPSMANLTYSNWPTYVILSAYIVYVLIKMFFVVAIEEFVFRGFFLQRLALGIGVRWSVVLSSALWAMGHLYSMVSQGLSPLSTVLGMLTFVVWGTALSVGYWRTGKSLWFPFGIHYGINISSSLLGGFFLTSFQAPQWLIGNPAWTPETGVFGTLVWLAAIGIIWKITSSSRVKTSRYEANLTRM